MCDSPSLTCFFVHPLSLTNGSPENDGFQVRNLLFLGRFSGETMLNFRGLNLPAGYSLLHYAAECVTDPEAGYRPAADGVEGICYDLLM